MKQFRFLASLTALTVGVLVALVVAVGGSAAPDATPAAPTKVTVTMREFSFTLSKSVVPRGKVVFTVINRGELAHDFVLPGINKKTPVFGSGGKRTLTVTFTKKGAYLYLCSVGEHFLHGMKGNLRVK